MVGAGQGGVVGAAVQRLLRGGAAADPAAVQAAGVLQHRGAEAQLAQLEAGRRRLPRERGLVVRGELVHVGLWGGESNLITYGRVVLDFVLENQMYPEENFQYINKSAEL